MESRKCKNCGAALPKNKNICEYCKSVYEDIKPQSNQVDKAEKDNKDIQNHEGDFISTIKHVGKLFDDWF